MMPPVLTARLRRLVCMTLLAASGNAWACVFTSLDPVFNLAVQANTDDAPGTFYGWGSRVGIFLTLCGPNAVFQTDGNLGGFTPVGSANVDGTVYPTYALSPTSPLVIFRMENDGGGGVPIHLYQLNDLPLRVNASSGAYVFIRAGAISRRGMTSQSHNTSEIVRYWVRDSPAKPEEATLTFDVTVTGSTCGVLDTPVRLRDITPGDLGAAGSTAARMDFTVDLVCPGDNIPVRLTLTDATPGGGGGGGRLRPAPGSTAKGVSIELLRNNAPVVFGQQWSFGNGFNGVQKIRLSARYFRESGALVPGTIEGQAYLTADYN